MKNTKRFRLILLCVNIVILGVFGVLFGIISALKRDYSSDNVKREWDSELYTYSQVSVYMTRDCGIDDIGIYGLRKQIQSKLKESSVKEDDTAGRLWIDCAAGEMSATVTTGEKSCDVTLTGTYGDYFLFHPEKLLSGSYYTEDDINIDTVVIDKQCSWQLFGAIDTAGMFITLGNRQYRIAAVIDCPDDGRDKLAYGNKPRIYVHYTVMKSLDEKAVMTTYEVCLPNVVKDYAYTVMKELSIAPEEKSAVVEQTGRFDLVTLFKKCGSIPEKAMITSELAYPWYENRVRGAEIVAMILSGPAVYLLLVPAFSLVYALFALTKLIGKGAGLVKAKAERSYQKKISKAYYKTHPKPEGTENTE